MFPPEMSPSRVFARALALALVLIAPAPARAQDADGLIKEGVELRRAGQDQAALEHFRRAYDLEPTPRALAQMGLAEQALGRWIDGEAHLARALEAAQDPWISKYRGTLEGSRVEIGKHLGSLSVTGGPDGAELRVDGRPVGTLPLRRTLRLPLGTFTLEASVAGHVTVARAVSIVAGMTTHEELSTAAPASPPIAVQPASTSDTRPGDDGGRAGVERGHLAWVAAGGAVALVGAGAALLYFGNRNASEYQTGACLMTGTCESLKTRGGREQIAGVTGLVLGGALGVTSVLLFLSTPSTPSQSSTAAPPPSADRRVACAPELGRWGASCALRF
jgi:tetratricopeptide (TPR) repeat protein